MPVATRLLVNWTSRRCGNVGGMATRSRCDEMVRNLGASRKCGYFCPPRKVLATESYNGISGATGHGRSESLLTIPTIYAVPHYKLLSTYAGTGAPVGINQDYEAMGVESSMKIWRNGETWHQYSLVPIRSIRKGRG